MSPYTLLITRKTPRGFARLLDRYTDPLTALHWARVNYEGNPDGIVGFELRYLGLLVADTPALVVLWSGQSCRNCGKRWGVSSQ